MRKILFRGKSRCGLGWKYGDVVFNNILKKQDDEVCISDGNGTVYFVFPESVGQGTGLKDKNGVQVFEGDILKCKNGTIFEVFWDEQLTAFQARKSHSLPYGTEIIHYVLYKDGAINVEVIGNVHDNLELLEGAK